jgi:SNF2 family DNA or RNA helicase
MSIQSSNVEGLINQKVLLKGHFEHPVLIEDARSLGNNFELRVRLPNGHLEEAVLTQEEIDNLLGQVDQGKEPSHPVDPEKLRLLIESARIRLAYTHDRQFAVSLSGIRTLPHQIEAVYMKMLPQPRLRFLLADDPGAGKTIMAGLLIKELKLREAIEKILILCPAPLTIQWQDELLKWFGEQFTIIFSSIDQHQLINPWQKENQAITSLDYAKQDGVRERIWQQKWNMILIDEAHKCSAYTKKSSNRAPEANETKRYQLAKRLTSQADHVLLLTATPHHGDEDRFGHFLRLLDPDLFPEPHRLGQQATEIRKNIFRLGENCPWALRRLKEDLKDINGKRLFPDRHMQTITFNLNSDEYILYKTVTEYINQFLSQGTGQRKQSAALARTVFQRRLASSSHAIHESLKRRLQKQQDLLDELEVLPHAQRTKRLAFIRGRLTDAEQDEDDLDDADKDRLTDEFTTALEMEQLKAEIAILKELVEQARRVRETGKDSKLSALKNCLNLAQFSELKDGRGKLLIFTEHRATLNHLREHLDKWGYSTCEIHGGMNPHERKHAQEAFRTSYQICVATEAAGEGINLQFCHLMINYDIPWNPTRLEQRLGRIHRIGRERDVYAYNFVATDSEDGQPVIEGRILQRLLYKLEQMREALEGRVFDVIGEVLSINEVNLPEMLREAAYDPRRLDEYIDQIDRIDPEKLKKYEEATGIALARANVDFSGFQSTNFEVEERRLMPKYVEKNFEAASREVGLKLEPRADGLWRIEHVPAELRSERLEAVRRLGKPEANYKKITFHKQHLDQNQHLDAVLLGPGHPLYAEVDERLNHLLAPIKGQTAFYIDPLATTPYHIHFFEISIKGQNSQGETINLYGETVAVREENGTFEVMPADLLLNLPASKEQPLHVDIVDPQKAADFLKSTYQLACRERCQAERSHYAQVCRDYLIRSFEVRIRAAEDRVMALRAREIESPEVALARQRAEQDYAELERAKKDRMSGLDRLIIARTGPIRHIATVIVLTLEDSHEEQLKELVGEIDPQRNRQSELAAEEKVIAFEKEQGWTCERVGHMKIGFDIRSISAPDPATGQYNVRRIEVKGRERGQPIRLTTNEWYKATQLAETYWLYIVWDPLGQSPELVRIQNPGAVLDYAKKEIVRFFEIPADVIIKASKQLEAGGK